LPGVTVTAKNTETGLTQLTVTDSDGSYRILNLPTGKYTVSAGLEGFNTVEQTVTLRLGSAPTISFTLQPSAVSETITVTSRAPIVEVTKTQASTTIETEQLKTLPIQGRNFTDLVLLTPETRKDRERGNLAISGQRGINTNVTVDGVDYNNSFFGGTTGSAEGRAPLSISQESIKEFTVITNGASVEFGRSAGGFVNVITKSGTNQMHGSAFYYNQPQSLISARADGVEPADQDKAQYGASLGGALLKDKLFYFGSWDQQAQSVTVPVAASVLDPAVFAAYPSLTSDPNYVQTTDGRVLFGRLDYQATSAHRFMARGNYTTYEGRNGTSAATNRSSITNGIEGLDSRAYVGSWSGTFGSSLINDLSATWVDEYTPREAINNNLPEIQIGTTPTYGSVSFLPITSTVDRKGLGNTLSYLAGKHVLKGGVEYNDTGVSQTFRGNWRGVFVFGTKADLLAGKWREYRQFGGLGGLTSEEAGTVDFGQKEAAAFVQDQWYLRPNVTLQAGLRWETLDNPDDPVLNASDRNANGTYRLTGTIPDVKNQWSPRIGLTYAPFSRTVLRASAGRFWSRTPALLFAQLFSSNGYRGTQYNIQTTTACPTDPLSPGWGSGADACRGGFNPNGTERIDFSRITSVTAPGVFVMSPDFTNPQTDRYTIGIEQEILTETAFNLEYTYAKTSNLERLSDTNLQLDRDAAGNPVYGANGLPRYANARPIAAYGRVTQYTSDATSKYYAISATFRRRFAQGLRAYANVTYSHDKDNDSNERNFSGLTLEDVNDPELNYAYSDRDQRWRSSVNFTWDTPWWGIALSGAYRYLSGQGFSPLANAELNNDKNSGTDRPTIGCANPASCRPGEGDHLDRNSFRQPDFSEISLRLGKAFNVGFGDVTVFGECFNCANSANRTISATNQRWPQNPGTRPA
ncbi:MAG TPA: TonB-dependent receptor, partial [Thermoanaerobaculia bacterium]